MPHCAECGDWTYEKGLCLDCEEEHGDECDSALFDADELGLDPERDGERAYHEEE